MFPQDQHTDGTTATVQDGAECDSVICMVLVLERYKIEGVIELFTMVLLAFCDYSRVSVLFMRS